MVRLMLASTMGAIGYLLLFAGIAERGRWALRPWDALTEATNTPAGSGSTASSSSGGGIVSKITGAITNLPGAILRGATGGLG